MFSVVFILLQFIVLAYALVSGVFLAFSDFIMRALGQTSGIGGVEAMQVINREVFRWVFMTLFIGLAPISLLVAIYGGVVVGNGAGSLLIAAGLTYLVGCFAVTVFCNVPLNETLSELDTRTAQTRDFWITTYLPRWTFWNTLRTIASALSALLLMGGLLLLAHAQGQAT